MIKMVDLLQEEIDSSTKNQNTNEEITKQNNITQNVLSQEQNTNELTNTKEQNQFLDSTIGKVINTAIDLGIRWVLPDFVENQIIDVKNTLIRGGLKEGIDKAVENAVELGKSVTGIFTGKFDNISQAQNAIKNGGIIEGVSNVIDSAISVTTQKGWLPKEIGKVIKQGKNVILDNVSSNIETEFVSQLNSIEKLGKYENNWRTYYKEQDFEGMEREYQKIKEKLKEIMPLETTIRQARAIENIHLLVKNNGRDFNISEEQMQLAGVLV